MNPRGTSPPPESLVGTSPPPESLVAGDASSRGTSSGQSSGAKPGSVEGVPADELSRRMSIVAMQAFQMSINEILEKINDVQSEQEKQNHTLLLLMSGLSEVTSRMKNVEGQDAPLEIHQDAGGDATCKDSPDKRSQCKPADAANGSMSAVHAPDDPQCVQIHSGQATPQDEAEWDMATYGVQR